MLKVIRCARSVRSGQRSSQIAARGLLAAVAATALLAAASASAQGIEQLTPVTEQMLSKPPAGDWLSYRATQNAWGYSELDQINLKTVGNLTLAWVASMEPGVNQGTALVHDGILFLPHPGDYIEALDASTGSRIWTYRRALPTDVKEPKAGGGSSISMSINASATKRFVAIYGDKIYAVGGDHNLYALDAKTGKLLWESVLGDYHEMGTSAGPFIADGKVITLRTCDASFAGGCFVAAHDAQTGKEVWRRYFIARPGEKGDETWNGLPLEKRVHVGAWGVPSYDAELGLLYIGTSVPAPAVEILRGTGDGDMLYSNSTLALDIKTGKIKWYFQHLPRDNWDMDHPYERLLVDVPVTPDAASLFSVNPKIRAGETRKLMTGVPGKTGIVWTLDRETGQFLWARPTVEQNFITEINPRTGRPKVNEDLILKSIDDKYPEACPSFQGGKNWPPSAYSPRTRAMYVPLLNACQRIEVVTKTPRPGDLYGLSFSFIPPADVQTTGLIEAISAETGKTLWKHQQPGRLYGALATAGDLVFSGDTLGRFIALDATNGQVAWATQLNASASGAPVTWTANGEQFVGIAVGGGDFLTGRANQMSGLKNRGTGNLYFAFKLPGAKPNLTPLRPTAAVAPPVSVAAPVPAAQPAPVPAASAKATSASTLSSQKGAQAYAQQCALCHGAEMMGGGPIPGLTGCAFRDRWQTQTIAEFSTRIKQTMPTSAPNTLSDEVVADIVSHWLQANGGSTALAQSTATWSATRVGAVPNLCKPA